MYFISVPITSAFTTAVAINIASTQVKAILGIKYKAVGFYAVMKNLFERIHETKLWDTVLGVSCIAYLTFFRVSTYRYTRVPAANHSYRLSSQLIPIVMQ
jgi:sodium-independent sulfate anion transporter 11